MGSDTKRGRIRYCCGEIVLSKEDGVITFNCSLCEEEFSNMERFLRHSLKHLAVPKEKVTVLVRDTIRHSLPTKYSDDYDFLEFSEEEDDIKFDIENVNISTADNGVLTTVNITEKSLVGIKTEKVDGKTVDDFSDADCDCDDKESDSGLIRTGTKITKKGTSIAPEKTTESLVNLYKSRKKVNFIEGVHIKDKGPYTCDECGKKIILRYNFIKHIRMHRGIKPYTCDLCGVTFTESSNLKVHRLRHLGIKPYRCATCDKGFTNSTDLKTHTRTHTGERPYKCETCGQAFKVSAHLSLHRRRHTNDRPHLCNICGKSFFQKKTLRDHLVAHSGERPYVCTVCNMDFSLSKLLKQHMQLHSDVKKYKCKICTKAFAQSAGLSSHMKTCHSEQRERESAQ